MRLSGIVTRRELKHRETSGWKNVGQKQKYQTKPSSCGTVRGMRQAPVSVAYVRQLDVLYKYTPSSAVM